MAEVGDGGGVTPASGDGRERLGEKRLGKKAVVEEDEEVVAEEALRTYGRRKRGHPNTASRCHAAPVSLVSYR
jgi:hypothetical protein